MEQDEEAGDMWQKKPLMVFGKPGFFLEAFYCPCNQKSYYLYPK